MNVEAKKCQLLKNELKKKHIVQVHMKFFISLAIINPFEEDAFGYTRRKRRAQNKEDFSRNILLLCIYHGGNYFLCFVCKRRRIF